MAPKSPSPGPTPSPPSSPKSTRSQTGSPRKKKMDILHYRTKRRNDRASKSSSTSDSGLSEFFRSTSISKRSSKCKSKTENRDPNNNNNDNNKKQDQDANESEQMKALHDHFEKETGVPGPDNLPCEPVLRAGILIYVTSPEGETSLGMCDDELPGKKDNKPRSPRSPRSPKILRDLGL